MTRNVWLLSATQALVMTGGALMVLVAGIFGAQVAPDRELATLPVALMILGTALTVAPMTMLMRKFGRKPMFFVAVLLGLTGSTLAIFAIEQALFWLFCAAAIALGTASAGFQQIRFAAIESVSIEKGPKALSMILLGGLVAAILGPELAVLGQHLNNSFSGAFYLLLGLMIAAACLLSFYQPVESKKPGELHTPVQSTRQILKSPDVILAIGAASIGFALMSFIMTATPLHMHVMEHHSMADTKTVIQSHIVAMFAPSFFSGWLIAKFGERIIIWSGLTCFALVLMFAYLAHGWWYYWLALVLLGVGWNFLFSAGTSLLTKAQQQGEKFKIQAVNEAIVFGMQALASLSAGAVLFALGWKIMMLACIPIMLVLIFMLLLCREQEQEENMEEVENVAG